MEYNIKSELNYAVSLILQPLLSINLSTKPYRKIRSSLSPQLLSPIKALLTSCSLAFFFFTPQIQGPVFP